MVSAGVPTIGLLAQAVSSIENILEALETVVHNLPLTEWASICCALKPSEYPVRDSARAPPDLQHHSNEQEERAQILAQRYNTCLCGRCKKRANGMWLRRYCYGYALWDD